MLENNKKIEFVKDTLGTRQAYHEIITKYGFTDSEKSILLQATANIMHSNIDKLLMYEAYEILNSTIQNKIATLKKKDKTSPSKKINSKIKHLNNFDRKTENKTSKILLFLIAGTFLIVTLFIVLLIPQCNRDDVKVNERVMQERIRNAQKSYGKKLEQKQKGSVDGAWAYMQIFVEKRLKSPKSADFPFGGGTYHTTDLGGGRYKVNSYVDSQNAFGANIRTHFDGIIKRKDGGWVLEYLNFRN